MSQLLDALSHALDLFNEPGVTEEQAVSALVSAASDVVCSPLITEREDQSIYVFRELQRLSRIARPTHGDLTNEDRAARAQFALSAYCAFDGYDRSAEGGSAAEEALGDMLADFMHYIEREGFDLDILLDIGYSHYQAEKEEEAVS